MSKEKELYNSTKGDNDEKKLTSTHLPRSLASYVGNTNPTSLPYHPSEESIERANGLDSSKSNPAENPIIATNNISS